MRILDKRIEQNVRNPDKRPQLLVLTGDQIYADDVADALLHMIMDASRTLLKFSDGGEIKIWDEEIPNIGPVSGLKPGMRAEITEQFGFTSAVIGKPENAKSHLMGLGEYLLMYLFEWSDVLWDDLNSENLNSMELEAAIDTIVEALPDYGTEKERKYLAWFRLDLWRVRRALANIPTYMIFDDHEITDDWYINAQWCKDTLESDDKSETARHIIANGLTAYALCQAWGNTPDAFKNGNGKELFDKLRDGCFREMLDHKDLEQYLLPPHNAIFAEDRQLNSAPYPIDWNFSITFDAFELVVVDSRTRRQYPYPKTKEGKEDKDESYFPVLISDISLENQISSFSCNLVVLVLAAPLVGFPGIEDLQRTRLPDKNSIPPGKERLDIDCEAPGLQPYFFERLLSKLAKAAPLDGVVKKANIVVFSGDLHFSYSARLRYSASNSFQEREAAELVVTQLTSSALKNHPPGFMGWALHNTGISEGHINEPQGIPIPSPGLPNPTIILGFVDFSTLTSEDKSILKWECLKSNISRALRSPFYEIKWSVPLKYYESGAYAARVELIDFNNSSIRSMSSDWKYRLEFLEDSRNPLLRDIARGARECVGFNNLGEVSFSENHIVFDLWWYARSLDKLRWPPTQTKSSLEFEDLAQVT